MIALCDSNISSYDVGSEFKNQFDDWFFQSQMLTQPQSTGHCYMDSVMIEINVW